MAAPAVPRYLLGQVLALMGLDGGNDRALANAEGNLDGLHRAREQVDALEVRIALVAPARRRVGWPASPPDGPVTAPSAVRVGMASVGPGGVEPPSNRL
jgi:hypothetical protein